MKVINLDKIAFQVTLHGGNARDAARDALTAAKKGNYEQAKELLEEAREEFKKGHDVHSKAMQEDDKDNRIIPTLLMSHAKDHLMTAKSEIYLIEELIELHKKVD